jgi:hypothetical protein
LVVIFFRQVISGLGKGPWIHARRTAFRCKISWTLSVQSPPF